MKYLIGIVVVVAIIVGYFIFRSHKMYDVVPIEQPITPSYSPATEGHDKG